MSLRILVLHSAYRSGPVSGENRVVEDEVKLLRQHGHDVVAWVETPNPKRSPVRAAQLGAETVWSARAAQELGGLIRRLRPDVIHGHNLFPILSPAVIRTASRRGVPFVLTLHNYRLMCLPATFFRDGRPCQDCLGRTPWPGVVHRCYRGSAAASSALASSLMLHRRLHTFDLVSAFLAVSRFVMEKHVEAGMPRSRFVLKPNFAWPAARRSGPGEHFLYLGRLTEEKGVRTLVQAWRGVDAPLVVAGDGPLRRELERAASPPVRFLGAVSADRALDLLGAARALILPSVWFEGAPRSIAEACAAGVPSVASRIGSLPEFVEEDRSGLLVPPGDAGALAGAVTALLDDGRSSTLGDGAHRLWRERFTPERAARDLETAYARAGADLHS